MLLGTTGAIAFDPLQLTANKQLVVAMRRQELLSMSCCTTKAMNGADW
jgi:hypothetical protein